MPTAPVRFPNGVTNVNARAAMRNLPFPDPSRNITYFDEFHTYTAAEWTVTETQAGATQAVSTGASGGILLLTNATGTTDVNQIQLVNETFKLSSGKQFYLKARFALTATLANFGALVGLAITDTTAVAGVSDGIFFRKPTGSSTLSAVVCKGSTETTQALGTMVSGTYVVAELYYDGASSIECFLDGAKIGTVATTNLPNTEELAVTIASVNATTGAANVLACDYLLASLER